MSDATRQGNHSRGVGRRIVGLLFTFTAAGLLLASLKFPLWQMRLEAPQYRGKEALHVAVHPNALRGDLKELAVLNQYIGVHIPPALPQFKWLPAVLVVGAVCGVLASLLPGVVRRRALLGGVIALVAALALAAGQARTQMRAIGHERDPKAALVGVQDFTPPFLGTEKIAQFEVSSRFGLGAWFIGAALALQLAAAGFSRRTRPQTPPAKSADRLVRANLEPANMLADQAVRAAVTTRS
jgi:copper chaperone NosL